MSTPKNRFRYVVTNRLGVMQVEPLGESNFTIEWTKQDDGKSDYKNELPSKITFTGEVFQKLLKIERSIYRCEFTQITVERRCTAPGVETWVPWFSGRMTFNDGDWDLDRCELEIKLDDIKAGQCYEDNKSKELNLLQGIFMRRAVYLNPTNITIEKVTYTSDPTPPPADCLDYYWGGPGDPYSQGYNVYGYIHTKDADSNTCTMSTNWAREVVELACGSPSPGPEWVLVADTCPGGVQKYARPARVYGCVYHASDYGSVPFVSEYHCQIVGDSENNIVIDNGLALKDVVELFLTNFCPGYSFVSNFFQINPDVPDTINYVTGQRSKVMFLTLFQKTDVKRPAATANASKALLSFEKLFETLIEMFNVEWRVEPGNVIRMEHTSYFNKNSGFDLTSNPYRAFVVGKRKYTYDNEDIPQREEYKFMEATPGDFAGVPIVYTDCVSQSGRNSVKTHNVDKFTTDVALVISNPDPDSKAVSDEGFVLAACDMDGSNFYMITESQILSGNSINNSLAWAMLHRDYHKYKRPLLKGTMNNYPTLFYSSKPTKKGVKITIPFCCADNFFPEDTIKTPLGVGVVDKASFAFKDETLELELLYPADQGLTQNIAPIANHDTASTYMDVPITIDILANDLDPDGVIKEVRIEAVPLHGTAVVNPDKSIGYTPAPGYVGDDVFLYKIYDDWGQPSTAAIVSIIVRAGNQPPIAGNDSYIGAKNTLLTVAAPGLFANDSDDVSYSLDTFDPVSAHGGTVVVNADGSFTYMPALNYVGLDTFTYTIKDVPGLTGTGTVTIDVRDPDNPIANDDGLYFTKKNLNLSIAAPGLLANDFTAVGTLAVVPTTISTAAGGTVQMYADGSFLYAPPAGYTGLDNFNYTATNGIGTDIANVKLSVLPDIYVHLQEVFEQSDIIIIPCTGGTIEAGYYTRGLFRLFFYANAAGTIPLDVTAFGLEVHTLVTGSFYSAPGTYSYHYTDYPIGTTYDIFNGVPYEFYHYETDCDHHVVAYTNENITLDPGLYTII